MSTNGMIIAFDNIVGNIFKKKLFFLIYNINNNPTKVANPPNTASSIFALMIKFDKKQPIVTDTIEKGSNIGNIQSASATLTCTTPKLIGANA